MRLFAVFAIATGYCSNSVIQASLFGASLPFKVPSQNDRVASDAYQHTSMRFVSLFLLFYLVAFSQTEAPILSEAKQKHVLDSFARSLKKEDPAVRQALIAAIGFPHMPYRRYDGMYRHRRIILFSAILLSLVNLFCLYVICLWLGYVFQKRGIRERYQRWTAARDLRLEQEEFLFRQGPDKKNRPEETEENFDKVE